MNYFNYIREKADLKKWILAKMLFALMIYAILQGITESPLIAGVYRVEFIVPLFLVLAGIVVSFLQLKYGTLSIVGEYTQLLKFRPLKLIKVLITQFLLILAIGLLYIVIVMITMLLAVIPILMGISIILIIFYTLCFIYLATMTEFALISYLMNPSKSMFRYYFTNCLKYSRYMPVEVIKYMILSTLVQFLSVAIVSLFALGGQDQIIVLFIGIIIALITNVITLWLAMSFDQMIVVKLLTVKDEGENKSDYEIEIDLHN